jgi:hypothetical protein
MIMIIMIVLRCVSQVTCSDGSTLRVEIVPGILEAPSKISAKYRLIFYSASESHLVEQVRWWCG